MARSSSKRLLVTIGLPMLAVVGLAFGCRTHFLGFYNYRAETDVAVVSVTPWDDAVSELEPGLQISAEEALKQVVPVTARDTLRVGLGASLSGGFSTGMGFGVPGASTGAAGAPAGTGVPDAAFELPERGTLTVPEATAGTATEFTRDPWLRYSAAASLIQEVRMLNQYVRDATMRLGYEPYLVRFQITPVPYERDLDLDVLVRMQFNKVGNRPVFVVPIILGDSIEATTKIRSLAQLYGLGLAIKLLTPQGTGEAALNSALSIIHDQAGDALSSLQSISSPNPSSIQVRIGAQNAGGEKALLPRAHYASVLVLVSETQLLETIPKNVAGAGGSRGEAEAQHATGIPVDLEVGYFTASGHMPRVDGRHESGGNSTLDGDWHKWKIDVPLPTYNDDVFNPCEKHGGIAGGPTGRAHFHSSFAGTAAVPQSDERSANCTITEAMTIFDDRKTATMDIGGLTGGGHGTYSAVAGVVASDGQTYWVRSNSAEAIGTAGVLKVTFPSFSQFAKLTVESAKPKDDAASTGGRANAGDRKPKGSTPNDMGGASAASPCAKGALCVDRIYVYRGASRWYKATSTYWPVLVRNVNHLFTADEPSTAAKPAAVGWTIAVGARAVHASQEGTGALMVNFALPKDKKESDMKSTTLRIDGADVVEVNSCDALRSDPGALTVKKAGRCKLSLANLTPGVPVTVSGSVDGGASTDIRTLMVVQQKAPKK